MLKTIPSLSILTLSYNTQPGVFTEFLEAIKKQNYPKNKIEHIIIDAGSTNGNLDIAKKYNTKIFSNKDWRHKISFRQNLAIRKSKNEIILWLLPDNILQDQYALKKLVKPFLDDKEIISTYTFHYAYNRQRPLLTRYCALMGISDPVVYYLGKADRHPWFEEQKGSYSVVSFEQNNLPTVGDNGFLIRRSVLLQANISKKDYYHTDVYIDLLKKGYKKFGVVFNTSIEHVTGKSFFSLIRRRIEYMTRDSSKEAFLRRRYQVMDFSSSRDVMKLLLYIFFTITIVQPFIISVKGYMKRRDIAWFVHPFICYLFLLYYGKAFLLKIIKK